MDEHALRLLLEGGGGSGGKILRAFLKLPSIIYGELMRLRRFSYESGIFHSQSAPVPVISIGNLAAGGTGKTPTSILLCEECLTSGRRPGILLRGYRAAEGLSDEAELYRRLCPEAIVETGADRLAAAKRACARGADILIMDDGFQHLRLKRNLDIVLIDALSPWGGGTTIPGGLLREPRCALNRAQAIIITRTDQINAECLADIKDEITRLAPQSRIFTARHLPYRLTKATGETIPIERIKGRKVLALCAIARPEAFALTLTNLGAKVVKVLAAADHRDFSHKYLLHAKQIASQEDAVLVVTEKDMVKKNFQVFADNNKEEILILGVRQEINDRAGLAELVAKVIREATVSSSQHTAFE